MQPQPWVKLEKVTVKPQRELLAKFVAVPLAWPLPMPLAGPWLWLLVVALGPLQLACPVLFHFFHICGAPCIAAHGILNKDCSALWRHSSPLRSPADGCSTPLQVRPLLGMDAKPKAKHIYSSLCWKQKLGQKWVAEKFCQLCQLRQRTSWNPWGCQLHGLCQLHLFSKEPEEPNVEAHRASSCNHP